MTDVCKTCNGKKTVWIGGQGGDYGPCPECLPKVINNVPDRTVFGLDSYQKTAIDFAIYPGKGTFAGITYTTLKLNGEAGEIAEKIGKVLRDDNGELSREKRTALLLELGDVLWYVAALGNELGYTLCEVANANIKKLADRSARGKLQGSGDNR